MVLLKKNIKRNNPSETPSTSSVIEATAAVNNGGSDSFLPISKRGKSPAFHRDSEKALFPLNPYFIQSIPFKDRRSIAFLLKLKQRFVNSRIYDYTPTSLAEKTGVSYYNVRKHVKYLLDNGYVFFDGDDLMVKSLNKSIKYKRKRKWAIEIHKDHSLNDIVTFMNFCVLKQNFKQQKYVRSIKRNDKIAKGEISDKNFKLKDYNKLRQIRRDKPEILHGALLDYNLIGVRKLSALLGCSLDKSSKFLKDLEKMGLIEKKVVKYIYSRTVGESRFNCDEFKAMIGKKAGYLYASGGCLWVMLGTNIILL